MTSIQKTSQQPLSSGQLPAFITFTGADDHTSVQGMIELAALYPIEWGILFSPKRQGQGRYPSLAWVRALTASAKSLRLSAHLCGGHSAAVINFGSCGLEAPIGAHFTRAQINTTDVAQSSAIREWADKVGVEAILQCRGDFPPDENVSWLFDASGGRGLSPEHWPPAFASSAAGAVALRGYAGGLRPENVVDAIREIALTPHDYWIDMETGVRDSRDRFDLNRCREVCEAVYGVRTTPTRNAWPDRLGRSHEVALPAGQANKAAEVNSAVRAEIVQLLTCRGRQQLVEAAKTDDLVDVVGMLFSEISDLDGRLAGLPALRERLAELEAQAANTHGPMQETIRKLNVRIVEQNSALEAAGLLT